MKSNNTFYIPVELDSENKFQHLGQVRQEFEDMKKDVEFHAMLCPACVVIEVFKVENGCIDKRKFWRIDNCNRNSPGVLEEVEIGYFD